MHLYTFAMWLKVYLFVFVQFWWKNLGASDKYDILKRRKLTWLSKENMEIILNYTIPKSRCCNVHVTPQDFGEQRALFKIFASAYHDEYTLSHKVYNCIDHILIMSREFEIIETIRKIPTEISATRILMLIDSKINEKSLLFNVTMYKNANVNMFFQNGSYTLSENYLEHRYFKKISRSKDLQRKNGLVNLKGRNLQIATFYNPPLCFLKTSINKTIKGIKAEIFVPAHKKEIDGIELYIFLIIAKTLNFTYTVRKPSGRYNHGRKYNDTAWDSGMIGQVINKEVDIAFGGIWITLDNHNFVNLTEPWTQIFIHFLVPRPQAYTSFWALTRPLSPTVWLAVVLVLTLESAYVYGKAWVDPFVPRRFRNIVVTFTEMMGRMLGTWLPRISPRVRLHFVLWELAGFVIVTSYCSSLAARLTNPEYEERIDTVKQFIAKNLKWGREGTPPHYKEYFDLDDKYAKQMPSRFILEKSSEDRIDRVLHGNYAVVGKIVGDVYYPEGDISNEALEILRVMRQPVGQFYTSFAVQSWLLEPINTVMLRLRESGIILYQLQHVIHRRTGTHLREVFVEHDKLDFDRAIVLAINPLGVGFATLILGLFVASIVFYIELRSVPRDGTSSQRIKDKIRRENSL